MRQVVAGLFISLDGVVEAPEGWRSPYFTPELAETMAAGIAQADAVLMGRRLYEEFAAFWPEQSGDVPMADFLNRTPKYVVSATLQEPLAWANSHLISGDLAAEVTKLKQQPGRNIQVPGSPMLVRSLLREGLLDRLALLVCPVVIGSGMRLFDGLPRLELTLVESTAYGTGALGVTYEPAERRAGDGVSGASRE